jgi:hypothetical protein
MSVSTFQSRQALRDFVAQLRRLRDDVETNVTTIKHVSLDAGGRGLIAIRGLLMADASTDAKHVLKMLGRLTVAEIVDRPMLPMDPEVLLGDLDTIIELADNLTKDPNEDVANPAGSLEAGVPLPRKRGRPSPIPFERKVLALEAKQAGRSNKEVAQILHGTSYPSDQQVKNVYSILRYFQRSLPQNATLIGEGQPIVLGSGTIADDSIGSTETSTQS